MGLAAHQSLLRDDTECQGFSEGSNVTQSHDARQSGVALGAAHIVHQGSYPSSPHHQLSQLRGVLGHLYDIVICSSH